MTIIPKMGGNPELTLWIQPQPILFNSLFSIQEGGKKLDKGLNELIKDKYARSFTLNVYPFCPMRSDLFLQHLRGKTYPKEIEDYLSKLILSVDPFNQQNYLKKPDIILLSVEPEINHSVWQHQDSGYLVSPPSDWEKQWTEPQKQWFKTNFCNQGLLNLQDFKNIYLKLIRSIKENLEAHILVFNASSIDPDDSVYNYYGIEGETLSLRIQKFNLALIELSIEEGISIIDIDYLVAKMAAKNNVIKPFCYSDKIYPMINEELLRVLEDIGFFEKRPLMMQLGKNSGKQKIKLS